MTNLSAGYWTGDELRELGIGRVGKNVRVSRSCEIVGLENIEIGDNVRIDAFCAIIATGPVRLGSWIHIAGGCLLSGRGGVTMDDFSGLSAGVRIYSSSDDYSGRHMTNPLVPTAFTCVTRAPVRLGRHAIVGAGSVILPGVSMGDGSALGAASLATRPIAPWTICGGVPARRIAGRSRDLLDKEVQLTGGTLPPHRSAAE